MGELWPPVTCPVQLIEICVHPRNVPMGYRTNPHRTCFYNLPCQFASKQSFAPWVYGTTVDRPAAIRYKRSTFCNIFFLFIFFPNVTVNSFLFLFCFFRTLHPFQKILAIGLTVKFRQNKAPYHHFGGKFSKLPVHAPQGDNQVCSV